MRVTRLRRLHLLAGAAEAPLALPIPIDRGVERGGVEIGPQHVGEIELGVGELPQQEVRDPLLAAGADEQVGLRRVGHREDTARAPRARVASRRAARPGCAAKYRRAACAMSQRPP